MHPLTLPLGRPQDPESRARAPTKLDVPLHRHAGVNRPVIGEGGAA